MDQRQTLMRRSISTAYYAAFHLFIDDFVEHCATRWEAGKAMLVCIDKITCARMYQRIIPRWEAKAAEVRADCESKKAAAVKTADETERAASIAKRKMPPTPPAPEI